MFTKLLTLIGFASFGAVFTVQAGPPLICHAYEIGSAKSLPWGDRSSAGWDNPAETYDVHRLSADTLQLLNHETPVIVRMETLRRATIYGSHNHAEASALIAALRQRAVEAGQSDALADFDYGYLIASVKQMEWRYKQDLTGGVDGYEYVKKALALGGNAEMQFAAAVMTSDPFRPSEREEHLRQARAAKTDVVLAQNLASFFK